MSVNRKRPPTRFGNSYAVPPEVEDFNAVLEFGAKKHGALNFLEPNGKKCSEADMFASIGRHLEGAKRGEVDAESGLDHILHAISRLQMLYIRRVRNIVHSDDEVK